MGTRSNLIVRVGQTRVFIYRHWDGYLSENGKDIAKAMIAARQNPGRSESTEFLANLLNSREEPNSRDPEGRRHYELTADIHGDIEWLYVIDYTADAVLVGYASGSYDTNFTESSARPVLTLEEFVGAVNSEIEKDERAARRRNPGAVFEPYQKVSMA